MRKLIIPLINMIIILAVSLSVITYVRGDLRASTQMAQDAFVSSSELICAIADIYMADTKDMCTELANYINGDRMSMQGAITFLNGAKVTESTTVHIIWADDLTGLSREPKLSDSRDYHVDYSNRSHIFDGWIDKNKTFITPRYTNPTTGEYVIAVCEKIRLYTNHRRRDAILMRVIPSEYLASKWVFPADYKGVDITIIDKDGKYIFKPSNMKNEDFYSYMYSYNQGVIDQNALKDEINSNESGFFYAMDGAHYSRMWSYRKMAENDAWTIVVSVPESEIVGREVDWFIPTMILLSLLLIFIIDVAYLGILRKNDRKVAHRLEEQGEQLKSALEKADEANRAKTVFLNNMSHDIRTPMNAIIGFTALAKTHIEQRDLVSDYLSKIMTASEHLLSLINDVLDMSRIESGKMKLIEKENSIKGIIDDLKNIMQADIEKRGLKLSIESENLVNDGIVCDRLRLNQVLINLLSNAVKFTNQGGTVSLKIVEIQNAREGYANFEFHVKDNGIGMSEEFAKHVFEPFTREENSTNSGIQGTGLGMAITKNLVDMMEGKIAVYSKPGEGTEVTVSVEFAVTDKVVEELTNTANCDINYASLEGRRILLVDDVELNREIAVAVLEEAGAAVETGENGQVAVDMVAASTPGYYDLVLMDVMMPVMDGYEATRIIRKLENKELANIPIIAMTANAFEEDRKAAMEVGMNDHIAKPFQIKKLYKVMDMYVK